MLAFTRSVCGRIFLNSGVMYAFYCLDCNGAVVLMRAADSYEMLFDPQIEVLCDCNLYLLQQIKRVTESRLIYKHFFF